MHDRSRADLDGLLDGEDAVAPHRAADGAARPRVGRVVRRVATACFWAHLAVLTVATHVPRVDPSYLETVGKVSPLEPDKTLHLVAYGLLGLLAGIAFTPGRRLDGVIRLFVALACWAFLDEFTQPLFGRGAELMDWCHDLAGLAVGLAAGLAADRWCTTLVRAAMAPPTRPAP
jgi:VanZ family protein